MTQTPRHFQKIALWNFSLFLCFLFSTSSIYSSETRLLTLGGLKFIPDETNIYFNPALLLDYSNRLTSELGEYKKGNPLQNQSGGLFLEHYGVSINRLDPIANRFFNADLFNQQYTPQTPLQIFTARNFNNLNLGAAIYFASDFTDQDQFSVIGVDSITVTERTRSFEVGLQLGGKVEVQPGFLDFWVGIKSFNFDTTWVRRLESGNTDSKSTFNRFLTGGMSIPLGVRLRSQLSKDLHWTNGVEYVFSKFAMNQLLATNSTSLTDYYFNDLSLFSIFKKNYHSNGGVVFAQLAIDISSKYISPVLSENSPRTSNLAIQHEMDLLLPKLSLGIEHPLKSWWIFRAGTVKSIKVSYAKESYQNFEKSTLAQRNDTQADQDLFITLGSRFKFNGAQIDIMVGENIFFEGPNFISGGDASPLIGKVSISYRFGKSQKARETQAAPSPISPPKTSPLKIKKEVISTPVLPPAVQEKEKDVSQPKSLPIQKKEEKKEEKEKRKIVIPPPISSPAVVPAPAASVPAVTPPPVPSVVLPVPVVIPTPPKPTTPILQKQAPEKEESHLSPKGASKQERQSKAVQSYIQPLPTLHKEDDYTDENDEYVNPDLDEE